MALGVAEKQLLDQVPPLESSIVMGYVMADVLANWLP